MDRRRPLLRLLALELALTTIGALMALVGAFLLAGSGGLVDDPSPRPVSAEIAAITEPLARAAFVKTFTMLAAGFVCVNLAAYVAFLVRPKDAGASSGLRRHFLILLLLATFIFDWFEAWLTTLFETPAVPGAVAPLLAWIVVGGLLWALVLARFARPAWPSHSAVGVLVAVATAIALSFLRRGVEASLFGSLPALAWLVLDKRLGGEGRSAKPAPAESTPPA